MEQGDFQQLVERHRDRVFTYAFYSLRSREDAEDVTQEVLIRLWRNRRKIDEEHIVAWLIKVAKNACIDAVRRRQTRRPLDGDGETALIEAAPADVVDPERAAENADFRRQLREALHDLPEPHRSIVVLREVQGLSYDEIAAAVERPLNTVKVYLHRGRKMLRDALREVPAYAEAS